MLISISNGIHNLTCVILETVHVRRGRRKDCLRCFVNLVSDNDNTLANILGPNIPDDPKQP